MKHSIGPWLLVGALTLPAVALAQMGDVVPGEEDKAEAKQDGPLVIPEDGKAAAQVLTRYLDAVKAKKWAEVKKLTHPKTLKAIAERKKRLGDEDHPMAPWFYEKNQYFMKEYKLTGVRAGPLGTWIFDASEDNYQVQEKGLAEGDPATYLVGKTAGEWVVVDKKRGAKIPADSVKYGYKGYFDPAPAAKQVDGSED